MFRSKVESFLIKTLDLFEKLLCKMCYKLNLMIMKRTTREENLYYNFIKKCDERKLELSKLQDKYENNWVGRKFDLDKKRIILLEKSEMYNKK